MIKSSLTELKEDSRQKITLCLGFDDKAEEAWQQSPIEAERIINSLTVKGNIVIDLFLVVCLV